jgi:hypothetical protein
VKRSVERTTERKVFISSVPPVCTGVEKTPIEHYLGNPMVRVVSFRESGSERGKYRRRELNAITVVVRHHYRNYWRMKGIMFGPTQFPKERTALHL